jgi:GAF domain-containing protein
MSGERADLLARGEEFLEAFRNGIEFARELLRENERLRGRLAELDQRCVEIEEENGNLASLYVATQQLHSTLDPDEVLRIVIEIAIDLIGADAFAIYLLDERSRELRAVAAEGVDLARLPPARAGEGRLGEALAAGAPRRFEEAPVAGRHVDPERPLVCIPLRIDEQAIGAIAIFAFLQQKRGLSALDQELFRVLGGHAATAIVASQLHARSERKWSALQGFIDRLGR